MQGRREAMQQSPNNSQFNIEQRLRTIRILWIAMLFSVVVYYVFTLFVPQQIERQPNSTVSLFLLAVGVLATIISFPIKRRFLNQAVDQQRVQVLQQGYIFTWAVNEIAALFGLLDFFLTGNRYYFVLFLIAAIGLLLHYPKRQHLIDASWKKPIE